MAKASLNCLKKEVMEFTLMYVCVHVHVRRFL